MSSFGHRAGKLRKQKASMGSINLRRFAGALLAAGIASLPVSGHADAPPGHFVVNGDGTVRDAMTGLTWQQAASSANYDWAGAGSYCASLSLVGTGWRLPSMTELQTIVDDSRSAPSIDSTAFPGTPLAGFWTGTHSVDGPGIWVVSFVNGGATFLDAAIPFRARCVR